MSWLSQLLHRDTLVFLMLIVAVITVGVVAVVKLWTAHRERMAMIERGMHPDHPPDEAETPEKTEGEDAGRGK